MPYEIVRYFQDPAMSAEVLETVDTLEEAQEHCNDAETSSSTCQGAEAIERTNDCGQWFDGYREV